MELSNEHCVRVSLCGWGRAACAGGGTGSPIAGWMWAWPWSSPPMSMARGMPSSSSTSPSMTRRRWGRLNDTQIPKHPSSLHWSNHWIEMTGEVKAMLWSQCLSHLQYLKSRCLLLRIYRYATVLLWIIQSFSFLDCLSQWSECIHFLPLPPFRYLSQYLHVFISDVTVLVPVLKDNSHHAFAVYTSDSTKQRWPLILSAQTEKDMADWVCLERPPFRYKQHTMFRIETG